jgi:four helix bundle protein
MQNFQDLDVYKKAYDLARQVYEDMKPNKNYRLTGQLFGSTTSICANLAEMAAFDTPNHQSHKVRIAIGEANETEFWLNFCKDSGELPEHKCRLYIERLTEIRKMLFGLWNAIKEKEGEHHGSQ